MKSSMSSVSGPGTRALFADGSFCLLLFLCRHFFSHRLSGGVGIGLDLHNFLECYRVPSWRRGPIL